MLALDGFRCCIANGAIADGRVSLTPMMPLSIKAEYEAYIKKLEAYQAKKIKNESIQLDEQYDGINRDKNMELYMLLCDKLKASIYGKRPGNPYMKLLNGERIFENLTLANQVRALLQILLLFGRSNDNINLELIGGAKNDSKVRKSLAIGEWKKDYQDVRIIDSSASGLHETKSQNLLELI